MLRLNELLYNALEFVKKKKNLFRWIRCIHSKVFTLLKETADAQNKVQQLLSLFNT